MDEVGEGRRLDVVEREEKKREQQHVEKEIQLNFLVCLNAAASSCRLNWHEVTPITDPEKAEPLGWDAGRVKCLIAERAARSLVSDSFHCAH
jgi:hypothetical protein